jgi:phosphoglycolate phosphatase-like HAD superfamily hydrolase
VTVPLDGIDLIIFDKDGTLIDFGRMWAGWAETLASSLGAAAGRPVDEPLFAMLGYDPVARVVRVGGGLAATPMARLRERTGAVLVDAGLTDADAERAVAAAWHAPDPVALAHPLGDVGGIFRSLRADGRRIAIATTDDRAPSERTLDALDLLDALDGLACADDGLPVKPAPDMVLQLCAAIGVTPDRTAVVGDSPVDLRMARAAGAGLAVGVLTGVGDRADLAPLADVVIESVEQLMLP